MHKKKCLKLTYYVDLKVGNNIMTNCISTYGLKKITKYTKSNSKNNTNRLQRRLVKYALNSLIKGFDYSTINAIDNATILFERAIKNNSKYTDEDYEYQRTLRQ